MSYKVEVHAIGESGYTGNGLRFATTQEAESYASDLFSRWFGIDNYRVVTSDEPVNYQWVNGKLERLG